MLEALVQLAATTQFAQLPPAAVAAVQTFLLDSLAVGVAGRRSPLRDAVAGTAVRWGRGEAAGVLGDALRLPAPSAAFLNAYQMHCQEFDCVHEPAVAHVMTAVSAAALAEAEQAHRPVGGKRFITSLALGVEVAAVLGLAAKSPLTFFRPATTGVFGAAVAVGALRGFGARRLRLCFGHALSGAAGTMQAHEEGKPTLPVQLGNAARAGWVAADLAAADIPAPLNALEGRYGYLPLFERRWSTSGLADALGNPWRVTELSHKPHPSGRATHGGIEGVLKLRRQGVTPSNLLRMELSAPPLIHQLVIRPAKAGMDVNYARLCFPYVGAVALTYGAVGLEHFAAAMLQDGQLLQLAQRFAAQRNDVQDPAAFTPQALTAELRDGATRTQQIDHLLGAPQHPLGEAERHAKVRSCLASVYADQSRAERLMQAVAALPEHTGVESLLAPVTGV